MLGGLSRAVLESTHSMGRGLSSASGAVADLASAASGGVVKAANGVAGAAGAVVGALAGQGQASSTDELRSGERRAATVRAAIPQRPSLCCLLLFVPLKAALQRRNADTLRPFCVQG